MTEKTMADNEIFVGKKDFMAYIRSISFLSQKHDRLIVRARGKSISRAVDLSLAYVDRFSKDKAMSIDSVEISSESFKNKEDKDTNVSSIKIELVKNNKK